MHRIRRVGVASLAKVMTVYSYLVVGVPLVVWILAGVVIAALNPDSNALYAVGALISVYGLAMALISIPAFALLIVVGSVISACVVNLSLRIAGGLKVELE